MRCYPPDDIVFHDFPGIAFKVSLDTGGIIWCNQEMEDAVGCSLQELKEKGTDFFENFIHPRDYPKALNIVDYIRSGVNPFYGFSRVCLKEPLDWTKVYSVIYVKDEDKKGTPLTLLCLLFKLPGKRWIKEVFETYPYFFEKEKAGLPELLKRKLTTRELELLPYLGAGRSNKEIAASVFSCHSTIKTHVKHIMEKFKVHTRVKLVLLLKDYGY